MKKLLFVVMLAVTFFSCKKDDEDSSQLDPKNFEYTDKTDAQMKADLENNSTTMMNEMKGLGDEPAVQATANLFGLLSSSESQSSGIEAAIIKNNALSALKGLNQTNNLNSVFTALRDYQTGISLEMAYKLYAGTYSYNFTTKELDRTPGDVLVIKFPASQEAVTSQSLNGSLTLFAPEVQKGTFAVGDQTLSELPSKIKVALAVDGTVVMTYLFTASYTSEGFPTSVTSTLTLGTYEFKTAWSYQVSSVSLNYSMKHGSTTLVDVGWELKGNFDKTNMDKLQNDQITNPTEVLTEANAHFQFVGIKIAGFVDFKDMYTQMTAAENMFESKQITRDQYAEKQVEIMNKDMALVLAYADNKVIAKVEAFSKNVQEYNWQTQTYETVKQPDMQFKFKTGSPVAIETYVTQNFADLVNEFRSFLESLQGGMGK